MNTNNRLQFRYHDQVFDTREEAVEYIKSQIRFTEEGLASEDPSYGFSLLAEPTVLLYKKEEDETDPHLILVIGSQTNDGTQYSDNRFCIIDIDKTEQEIADLAEELEKAIKSLTLIALSSDTLNFYADKTDEGTYVSGDVKVAETHMFDDSRKNNNMMITPEGLFIYVNLEYDEEKEEFTFFVSNYDGTLSETTIKLPNNYVVEGYYSKRDESIHLVMKEGGEVVIDCEKLIAEWSVEGDASKTPVVLTREELDYDGTDEHHHIEPWQDVLRADIRIKDEEKILLPDGTYKYVKDENSTNILNRTSDARYLYVDGKASNIIYYKNGEKSTVKAALDELQNVKLSTDNDNIIINKPDGFFASTKLSYISKQNKLVFKASGQEDTVIQLNGFKLFENIYYDPTQEALVITYIDGNDKVQIVTIPIGEMIRDWEWEPQNEGHNVKIVKKRNVAGNDKVSADAKIYNDSDNILVDKNHELFVKGTADNIKYGNTTVKGALDALKDKDEELDDKIDAEITRAIAAEEALDVKIDQEIVDRTADVDEEQARAEEAEQVLDNKIGTGFTDDPHENVTYKFEQLYNKLDSEIERSTEKDTELETALNAEIARSTEKDTEHDEKIEAIETTIGSGFSTDAHETVTYKFEQLQNQVNDVADNLQNEIDRSIAKDNEHDGKIQSIEDEIGDGFGPRNTVRDEIDNLQSEIESISADSASSIKDIINIDESINVDKTDPVRPVISVNLSEEVEHGKENVIKLNADGLYAGVDLSYIEEANKLIFSTTNGSKEIELKSMSSIISIEYNPSKEAIVITYMTNGHEIKTVEIPVGDLIDEWRVEDGHPHAVALEKVRVSGGTAGQDVLKASVVITDDHDDNILVMDDGALYVPGGQIEQNKQDIADLKARMTAAEGDIDNLEDGLASEIARSTSADATLDEKINQEIFDRIADVNAEETRAKAAESALSESLQNEITRATSEEQRIEAKIDSEITRSTAKDQELANAISTETNRATSAETALQTAISNEVTRATNAESTLNTAITNEISRATAKDSALEAKDNEIIAALQQEITNRQEGDAELAEAIRDSKLTFEDTDSIDFNNPYNENNTVKANVKLQDGDNIIKLGSGLYASVNLSYDPARNTIKLVTSNGEQEAIQLNTVGSLIDGIEYDSVNRALVIKYHDAAGNPLSTSFPVNELFNDWIIQNPSEKSALELTKVINTGDTEDVLSGRVLITDDHDGDGKPDQGSDNIIEIRNNGLYVDGSAMSAASATAECVKNELKSVEKAVIGHIIAEECGSGYTYEPNQFGTYINSATSFYNADYILDLNLTRVENYVDEVSAKTDCVDSKANAIYKLLYGENQTMSQCGEDEEYRPYPTACILSAATSFSEADQLLNDQICHILTMWVSGITCTNESTWIEDGLNRKLQVDTRLSHGNLATMADEDLYINNLNGDYIDPTGTEFTDTNALRIICLDESITPAIETKQNGLYLSSDWDCGLYYDEETPADQEAKNNAQAAGYNTNYSTDLASSARNYNYMNNVRQHDPLG